MPVGNLQWLKFISADICACSLILKTLFQRLKNPDLRNVLTPVPTAQCYTTLLKQLKTVFLSLCVRRLTWWQPLKRAWVTWPAACRASPWPLNKRYKSLVLNVKYTVFELHDQGIMGRRNDLKQVGSSSNVEVSSHGLMDNFYQFLRFTSWLVKGFLLKLSFSQVLVVACTSLFLTLTKVVWIA